MSPVLSLGSTIGSGHAMAQLVPRSTQLLSHIVGRQPHLQANLVARLAVDVSLQQDLSRAGPKLSYAFVQVLVASPPSRLHVRLWRFEFCGVFGPTGIFWWWGRIKQ